MPVSSKSSGIHTGSESGLEDVVVVSPAGPDNRAHDEVQLIDVLLVLAQKKGPILAFTAAVALVALIVSFLLPKMYTATASILPPEPKQSSASLLMGQIGMLGGLSSSDLGLKNPDDLFVAMLKSRTVEDGIINQFDLRQVYGYKRYQDTRKKLESRSKIDAGDEGIISISVSDRDPKRAAQLANAYVDQLRSLNQNLAVSEAGQRRLFYQEKVDAERDDLAQAELAMRQTQEKTGLLQPDAQAKAMIQSVADMRAQVAIKEVQVGAMRTYATKDNPDLRRAEQELAGLRSELARLERNTGQSDNPDFELPTRRLPQAELEYLRRARDLKYHEVLYEFLNKQLEAARLDEAKEAVIIQVVDKAVEPERKSSPQRLLIVLVSAAGAFLVACLAAFLTEAWRRKQQDPHVRARVVRLRHLLKFQSTNS